MQVWTCDYSRFTNKIIAAEQKQQITETIHIYTYYCNKANLLICHTQISSHVFIDLRLQLQLIANVTNKKCSYEQTINIGWLYDTGCVFLKLQSVNEHIVFYPYILAAGNFPLRNSKSRKS